MPKFEPSETIVYKTKNYEIFKDITGNRIIDRLHQANLEEAVEEKNWLANEPGMVNENFELIDGQHRLAVAKKKHEYFYFTIGEGAGARDVILLNTNTKDWTMPEYLHYYMATGNENYIRLNQFAEKNKLNLGTAAALLSLKDTSVEVSMSRKAFKAGEFVITSEELANDLIEWMKKFRPLCISDQAWQTRAFVKSIWRIMINEEISIDDVYNKAKRLGQKIYRQDTDLDYLRQFEDIYNAGIHTRNHVRLY